MMDKKETVTYELCNVKGSCGHWLPDFWFGVDGFSVKSWGGDEEWGRTVSYESLCPECYADKKRFNLILVTEPEEQGWMRGELPEYCCPYCGAEIEVEWRNAGWDWKCDKCGCSEEGGIVTIVNPWKDE